MNTHLAADTLHACLLAADPAAGVARPGGGDGSKTCGRGYLHNRVTPAESCQGVTWPGAEEPGALGCGLARQSVVGSLARLGRTTKEAVKESLTTATQRESEMSQKTVHICDSCGVELSARHLQVCVNDVDEDLCAHCFRAQMDDRSNHESPFDIRVRLVATEGKRLLGVA